MQDCIFCKIATGVIQTRLLYQNKQIIAFNDLNPQAPVHVLIIPRQHIATLNDLTEEHTPLMGQMIVVAQQLAAQMGVAERGYRTVFNCNAAGGQSVFHIHLHLLGGRSMDWPPG